MQRCLPVDWLHLSCDAYHCSWRKVVKFLEQVPDVGPVFQVQVKLHNTLQTWKIRTAVCHGSIKVKQNTEDFKNTCRLLKEWLLCHKEQAMSVHHVRIRWNKYFVLINYPRKFTSKSTVHVGTEFFCFLLHHPVTDCLPARLITSELFQQYTEEIRADSEDS